MSSPGSSVVNNSDCSLFHRCLYNSFPCTILNHDHMFTITYRRSDRIERRCFKTSSQEERFLCSAKRTNFRESRFPRRVYGTREDSTEFPEISSRGELRTTALHRVKDIRFVRGDTQEHRARGFE